MIGNDAVLLGVRSASPSHVIERLVMCLQSGRLAGIETPSKSPYVSGFSGRLREMIDLLNREEFHTHRLSNF